MPDSKFTKLDGGIGEREEEQKDEHKRHITGNRALREVVENRGHLPASRRILAVLLNGHVNTRAGS